MRSVVGGGGVMWYSFSMAMRRLKGGRGSGHYVLRLPCLENGPQPPLHQDIVARSSSIRNCILKVTGRLILDSYFRMPTCSFAAVELEAQHKTINAKDMA